jgi:penicillin-binding protein 1C
MNLLTHVLKTLTLRAFATLREIKSYKLKLNKIISSCILICFLVRLCPYFAPIHSVDIAQHQLAIEFTDRNNLPLGTVLTSDQENTSVVKLNQVSPQFIKAILAAEDGSFYQHGALDLKAILRAIKIGVENKKIVSGASTITMQLARMLDNSPRTMTAKLKEIWLSWQLEARTGNLHDQINFQVKLGNIQPKKQGCSVANPTK